MVCVKALAGVDNTNHLEKQGWILVQHFTICMQVPSMQRGMQNRAVE